MKKIEYRIIQKNKGGTFDGWFWPQYKKSFSLFNPFPSWKNFSTSTGTYVFWTKKLAKEHIKKHQKKILCKGNIKVIEENI